MDNTKLKKLQELTKQMRYSQEELSLIKNTFSENIDIIKVLRKFFLQLPLTENEANQLESFKTSLKLQRLLRKTFLPEIEGDESLNQVIDLWMTLNIADKTEELAKPHLTARSLVIEYVDQQLGVLEGKKEKTLILKEMISKIDYSNLLARNTIIQHLEQQLTQLFILAGLKEETPEQTIERLKKDSNK